MSAKSIDAHMKYQNKYSKEMKARVGYVRKKTDPRKSSQSQIDYASRSQLTTNYGFRVFIDKNIELRFSKISGLETSVELEQFGIGGKNDSPYCAVKANASPGKIILEKGICISDQSIENWRPGLYLGGDLEIFVGFNRSSGSFSQSYCITGGYITRWEVTELDAMGSDILIDKFEITHMGITIG